MKCLWILDRSLLLHSMHGTSKMVLWLEVVLHLIMFTLELGASTVFQINLSTCELHGTSSNIPLSIGGTGDHGNADVLSRLPVGPDISCDEGKDVADVCTIKTVSLQLDPTDPGTMAKEWAKDPVIANVMCFTREG